MSKYLWCSLVLAFWCATTAPGASLAYEGFDYVAATPLVGQNGGSGFAAPWVADPGVIVQPSGLSVAVALPSAGLSIGGGFNAARQLTSPLNETEYWASFQIQANPGNDQVYLGFDAVPSATPLISFGRFLNTYFIRQGASTTVQAGVASAPGVTDLLVARFRQSGAITLVELWVNTGNFTTPPLLVLPVPTVPYTWVNLQVQPGILADEVRIGTTSGDVASTYLPVYGVTQAGATDLQGTALANYLNIPTSMVAQTNGWVTFVDPTNHLAVPTAPVTDPSIISNLLSTTQNLYPAIPIEFRAIDFAALANLPVLDDNSALGSASNALSSSGLTPQFGTPVVGHTRFTAFYTNDAGTVISNTQHLDTLVSYHFSLPGGYPLIGPGAQVQVAFGPAGNVTRLLYAARQLTPGPLVQIISAAEAGSRAAALFPADAQISVQLVYWAPPLWSWQNPLPTWQPNTLIPWYACRASVNLTDPATGLVSPVTLKTRLIPATDNPEFVPSLNLAASGTTQVVASVSVTGGKPPYTYLWAGSDPRVSANTSPSISYTPTRRLAPPALAFTIAGGNAATIAWPYPSTGFVLESATDLVSGGWSAFTGRVQTDNDLNSVSVNLQGQSTFFRLSLASPTLAATDTVGVNVTDANGVSANGSQTLPVQAVPDRPEYPGPPRISYGTESPNEPSFAVDRIGWQNGMGITGGGGGSESFCWMGDQAWPGDFIEPPTPGIFVSTSWVYGDADYSGINTASIVLNNTDGAPDFFCASAPDTTSADYNTAGLARPGNPAWKVVINRINNKDNASTHYYNINYNYSWGPLGPHDFLNWLCMDCCDALDETGPGGSAPKRWGPASGGLHILTGFNSGEAVADGSFEYNFARYMLKPPYPWTQPLPVVGAWFLAGFAAGYDDHGRPAAMGPIGPGGVSDYLDHYWGKGPVNPTIPPSKITGWWYVTAP